MYDTILGKLGQKRTRNNDFLISSMERIEESNFIYQHDNVPVHTSKQMKQWLRQKISMFQHGQHVY